MKKSIFPILTLVILTNLASIFITKYYYSHEPIHVSENSMGYSDSLVCVLKENKCPNLTPLDSATEYISNYAKIWNLLNESILKGSDSIQPFYPTCAFAISLSDMVVAFGITANNNEIEYSNEFIRAYIGMNYDPGQLHLYFTPLDSNGQDQLLSCGDDRYVMELTTPCPNTCDENSKLFNAFNDNLIQYGLPIGNPFEHPLNGISENCLSYN